MADIEKVRNIGISAHIDSGKTTLTERILYYTKKIHKIEEVKGKSGVGATMDFMDLEREKGITIQSAATYCEWKHNVINIIDTPGHVDFTIEVERALRVLDGAILVLCSVSGVQSQSITVDRQMTRYHVPRIAFVNKMDRAGANPYKVTEQLREKLGHNAHLIAMPIGAEDKFEGVIDLLSMKAHYFDGDNGEKIRVEEIPSALLEQAKKLRHDLTEAMGDFDDEVAQLYLDDKEVPEDLLRKVVRKATLSLKFIPVMIGSAYKNKGVQLLLDAVGYYLPNPSESKNEALDQDNKEAKVLLESSPDKPFVGLAFKLEDGRYGQLTYMRIYQGRINKGAFIINATNQKKVKIPRLVRMHADEMNEIDSASAGDIVAMFGVDCASGDTFTDGKVHYTMTSMHVPNPVISLAVAPKDQAASANFSKALNRFSREDPTFKIHRDEESAQTIISGMGELHLEIYIERMKREYNCEVIAGQPQVAYREAITQKTDFAYQHKKQTGGSGQYAKIGGYFEPLPPDAVEEYEFVDEVVGGKIPREFIPSCDKGFQEQLKKGLLIGFPVVGVRAVLNDGAYHDVDSSDLAFRICAMTAVREFYHKCKPVILEPIMKLQVQTPDEFQGPVVGQINQRRGMILGTAPVDRYAQVDAEVPLSQMFGFSTDLRSITQGKGEFQMEFLKYAPVPRHVQEELIEAYLKKKEAERK
ncbi:MAG: elongation factor G [Deltaproteobacteria bacterium]|nr:elongation factor G [Deltaproteobacteria bacterium]MDZ4224476.1 elongation factor G [bacterium]